MGMDSLNNLVHNRWVTKGTYITQLILLARQNLPQDSPHDLARSGLGQIFHDDDVLGSRERANCFANLEDEFLGELWSSFYFVL